MAFLAWYRDLSQRYKPRHAAEKFAQCSSINFSAESSRRWLSSAGLWNLKARKNPLVHLPRQRRPQRGELVQVDGGYHEWVRGERWTLLTFIDEAVSESLEARFVSSESSDSYHEWVRGERWTLLTFIDDATCEVPEAWLRKQGLPDANSTVWRSL